MDLSAQLFYLVTDYLYHGTSENEVHDWLKVLGAGLSVANLGAWILFPQGRVFKAGSVVIQSTRALQIFRHATFFGGIVLDTVGLGYSAHQGASLEELAMQLGMLLVFNTGREDRAIYGQYVKKITGHNTLHFNSLISSQERTPAYFLKDIKDCPLLMHLAREVEPFLGQRVGQTFQSQATFKPESIYSKTTIDDFPSVRDFQKNVLDELEKAQPGELCIQEPARRYLIWMIKEGVPDPVLAHAIFMATVEDFAIRLGPDLKLEAIDYVNMLETEALPICIIFYHPWGIGGYFD